MLKDFRDKNLDIVIMFRDTDAVHNFQYTLPSGSVFVPNQYTITCEGRLSYANEKSDFQFTVTPVTIDGESWLSIAFPSTLITSYIRENKIYYKVLATPTAGTGTFVINYGEIWLK